MDLSHQLVVLDVFIPVIFVVFIIGFIESAFERQSTVVSTGMSMVLRKWNITLI